MTVLEYLKKLFQDDADLRQYDISEGSNYYDLVYKTLKVVLEEGIGAKIVSAADLYNLNLESSLSYDELANIAAQYGIPAPWGNLSNGSITLVFNTPVDVTIPAGTTFSASGNLFLTRTNEYVLAKYLESNTPTTDGKYQSQPIDVFGTTQNSVKANTLNLSSLDVPELARVEHASFINGTPAATNELLAAVIRGVVRGSSAGSTDSVKAMLQSLYPRMTAIEVVTGNDALMTRDLMINSYVYGTPAQNEKSFLNKVFGNNVTNENVAYSGTSTDATPPDIDSLYGKTELSQYQYINLGNIDAEPLTIGTDNIYFDDFSSNNTLGATCSLDCPIASGDDYFYAYGAYWIEPGSTLNIEGKDNEDALHRFQVIVREVTTRLYDLVEVADTDDPNEYTVELAAAADDIIDKIKAGQIIDLKWVRIPAEDDYDLTITVKSVDTGTRVITFEALSAPTLGVCDATYPGKAMWTEVRIVGLFDLALTDTIANVPDNIQTQIGGGWFVSEHGYPVGMKVAENEVYIENERLVLGGTSSVIQDPLRDVIIKGGTMRFIGAVLRSTSYIKGPMIVPEHVVQHEIQEIK